MSTIALLAISLVFIKDIPISLLPDIPIPRMTVQISEPSMDARTLETTITRVIRNQLLQVNNLKDIQSTTRNGSAFIELDLEFGTNNDLTSIEVNELIDQVMYQLPRDLKRPRVIKTNVADIPVFNIDIYQKDSVRNNHLDFSKFIKTTVKKRLEQLPEIAFVDIHGITEPEIVVIPDPILMANLNIDETIIARTISNANIRQANITLKDGQYQYNVDLTSRLVTVSDIEQIYIDVEGRILQLKELAEVSYSKKLEKGSFYLNDHIGVSLAVRSKASVNNFKLRAGIDALIKDMRNHYPKLEFELSNDQSKVLEVSISNLRTSLIYGMGFAALVMFVFFRDWRIPLLIVIVIPSGLILTLFGFYLLDISINIISLSGLILGIGLMIDNAIIIMDNINSKMNELPSVEAASCGADEVIRPLISSALTTSSVFIPMILLSGIVGVLFYDQALSITLALFCSIAVSYFLLPVLANKILSHKKPTNKDILKKGHSSLIKWVLHQRYYLLPIMLLLAMGSIWFFFILEKDSFPKITKTAYEIKVDWNEQISLKENETRYLDLYNYSKQYVNKITAHIGEFQYFLHEQNQFINESTFVFYLNDPMQISNFRNDFSRYFNRYFAHASYTIKPLENSFDRIFQNDKKYLSAHIQSVRNFDLPPIDDIKRIIDDLKSSYPNLSPIVLENVIGIDINYDRLLTYNVDIESILNKLKFLFRTNEIDKLISNDEYIPIQLSKSLNIQDIGDIISNSEVRNREGVFLPLKPFITHRKFEYYKEITAVRSGECVTLEKDNDAEQFINDTRAVVSQYPNYLVSFGGSYFENKAIMRKLLILGAVVLLLVFMILAAQFESLLQPFIIALTLPIGILGALAALYLTEQSLNVVSVIGIIIMSGIDVNDAILKIDIINRKRKLGVPIDHAIYQGSILRIRPIVMTSVTTILAMTPILFSNGLGAEIHRPLAIAVIGGLVMGTFASIVMIPILYRVAYGRTSLEI